MASRRALVVGGSLGGLFTAHTLRRRGWDVAVFERTGQPLAGRGAGIVTHPELWNILESVGLQGERDLGVAVTERITLDREGAVLGVRHCPQVLTSWDRVFSLLRAIWPDRHYHLGRDLRRVSQDAAGVTAHFADGSTETADLLVACDGFRSVVRQQYLGEVQPLYAGYIAWRGLVAEADIPPAAHAMLFNRFGFCLPEGEQLIGYPVAGQNDDLRPGHRRYNVVWYRPAHETQALPRFLTDIHGHTHAVSIPPTLIRPEVVAEMRADAARLLAPQFAAIIQATKQPFLQPIYDLETPQMAFGRVALVGDAAFVIRPHVGAGVTKAAEDAACLAAMLDGTTDVAAALLGYEALRLVAGRRIVQRARHLGAYMQAVLKSDEEREAAERHHTPEAVMAETALLNF
jgi:2-polyprenyl-6-methoxyphenol hydroxylase-like FAD-dependent oxidoreductase